MNTYLHVSTLLTDPECSDSIVRVNWKATETMFLESIDPYAKKLVQKRTSGTHIPL